MVRLNLQLFALNTGTSIVDYLKNSGLDSSYSARKILAENMGIKNYTGTASQNTQMLKSLQNNTSSNTASSGTTSTAKSTTNNSSKVTAVAGTDQSLTDKIASSFTQSDAVTNKKNEAQVYEDKVKELTNVTDIVDQKTWDALNTQFQTSTAYQEAMNYTNQLLEQLSSGRTSYTDQIRDLMSQIQNREDFQYDVSTDTMFQQALSNAMNSGRMAMQDTIGQASALTGGYASTYATSAGNQAYNAYIQDAYNNLPEYYNMALEAYQMEGQEMYNQLAMLNDADATEYQRMYDSWNANFTNTQSMYAQEYGAWQDSINNAYNSANLQLQEHGQLYEQAYNTYNAINSEANNLYAQEYQRWQDEITNATNLYNSQQADYWNRQDMDYKYASLQQSKELAEAEMAQNQAQFEASLSAKGPSASGSDSGSTLTDKEIEKLKNVYINAGGGEEGNEAVYRELAMAGKNNLNADVAEALSTTLSRLDSGNIWERDWTMENDTRNGNFLGLSPDDDNDVYRSGNTTKTFKELKAEIANSNLSQEEKEKFLNKLRAMSTK